MYILPGCGNEWSMWMPVNISDDASMDMSVTTDQLTRCQIPNAITTLAVTTVNVTITL